MVFRNEVLNELTSEDGMWTKNFDCKNEIRNKMWSPPPTTGYSGSIDNKVVYQFEDPKTYSGPVVQGWEPGKFKQFVI
jgi:hypothetical protein